MKLARKLSADEARVLRSGRERVDYTEYMELLGDAQIGEILIIDLDKEQRDMSPTTLQNRFKNAAAKLGKGATLIEPNPNPKYRGNRVGELNLKDGQAAVKVTAASQPRGPRKSEGA